MNETGTPPNEREPALSPVLIQLFKGVLYRDDQSGVGAISPERPRETVRSQRQPKSAQAVAELLRCLGNQVVGHPLEGFDQVEEGLSEGKPVLGCILSPERNHPCRSLCTHAFSTIEGRASIGELPFARNNGSGTHPYADESP